MGYCDECIRRLVISYPILMPARIEGIQAENELVGEGAKVADDFCKVKEQPGLPAVLMLMDD